MSPSKTKKPPPGLALGRPPVGPSSLSPPRFNPQAQNQPTSFNGPSPPFFPPGFQYQFQQQPPHPQTYYQSPHPPPNAQRGQQQAPPGFWQHPVARPPPQLHAPGGPPRSNSFPGPSPLPNQPLSFPGPPPPPPHPGAQFVVGPLPPGFVFRDGFLVPEGRGGPPPFPPPQQQQAGPPWMVNGPPLMGWMEPQNGEGMMMMQPGGGVGGGWNGMGGGEAFASRGGPIDAFDPNRGTKHQQAGYSGARPSQLVTFNGPPPPQHFQKPPSASSSPTRAMNGRPFPAARPSPLRIQPPQLPPPSELPAFAPQAPGVPPLPPVHSFWHSIVAPAPGQASSPAYRSKAVKITRAPAKLTVAIASVDKEKEKEKVETARAKLLPPASSMDKDFPPLSRKTSQEVAEPSSSDASAKSSSLQSTPSTALSSPLRPQDSQPTSLKDNTSIDAKVSARVLDKYGEVFIPNFLHALQQEEPQFLHPLAALSPFPLPSYPQSFLPQPLLLLPPPPPNDYLLFAPPVSPPVVRDLPPLEPASYKERWRTLLGWELDSLGESLGKLILWKLQISVVDQRKGIYQVFVPGIREDHPKVEVGDVVLLKEVYLDLESGGQDSFQGRVIGLIKRDGFIHIQVPHLWPVLCDPHRPIEKQQAFLSVSPSAGTILPTHFNLTFKLNATPSVTMFDSVVAVSKALEPDWICQVGDEREKMELARPWLFPKQDDISKEPSETWGEPIQWVDENLNEEQKTAVATIASKVSRVPYLISGPFGTGKTKSVVEAVLQILRCQPDATVLLAAPSNSAADTLALRLRKTLRPPDMLRLNDRERTFAEVPDVLLPFCYIESDHFALPPFAQLMSYRVVLCSCLDAAILLRARASNEDLGVLESSTTGTIHRGRSVEPHWTHLLIDEAGQGSEPELLIPISVVLPYRGGDQPARHLPQLVLCGDPQQLGPIVTSEAARSGELDVSLLERLFEQPIYTSKSQVFPRPFTNLVKNYRCHPALLMTPSSLFYGDTLEPAAKNGSISWTELPNEQLPFVFFNVVGDEEMVDEHASWYNDKEGDRVVEIIRSLLEESSAFSPPLKPSDIGVMAPFREQVWRVRTKLRKVQLGSVDVGSVEDYQGRESRITIVSTVRSRDRFLDEDKLKGLGLVFEQKRFNVAITRAKELLIVVGNASLLSRDPYWGALLAFSLRNKLFIGPPVEGLQPSNAYISRLESSYLNSRPPLSARKSSTREQDVDEEEEEEAGAALSGAMAREALREEDS